MENQFKPNIYPIMYWALAFGAAAGVLLFLVSIASAYIGAVWFPIFLVGLVWGGYRNYKMQKARWYDQQGQPMPIQSPMQEFKQAVTDIADASQEIMNQESQERPVTPDTQPIPEQDMTQPEQEMPEEDVNNPTNQQPPQQTV